jgi:hypothetical protein
VLDDGLAGCDSMICADAGLVAVAAPDAATGMAVAVVPVKVVCWATTDAIITELAATRVVHKTVAVEATGTNVVVVENEASGIVNNHKVQHLWGGQHDSGHQ